MQRNGLQHKGEIMKRFFTVILVINLLSILNYSQDNQFKFGAIERIRLVSWDNAITLNKSANAGNTFSRIRTSVFGTWQPNEQWEATLKFTNEFRHYFNPQRDFDINEIFVDNFYLKYNDTWGTATIGRQNIMLGEGFVVMDGHPLDGSRSIYFNAVRLDLKLNTNHKVTLFASYQPETDNILPVINDFEQKLIEQPETGIGAYYFGKIDNLDLQGYYIFKNIKDTDAKPVKSNIHTLGARVNSPVAEQLSLTAETAYQFGDCGDYDRAAMGGYAYLTYQTKTDKAYLPVDLSVGGIYLSGDDPRTEKIEGWDPLFSRWPKWSESYIYTQIVENKGKVAYWSNFASLYAKMNFDVAENVKFCFDYHHMLAPQDAPAGSFPGGSGSTRGDLIIGKMTYNINKNVSGHLLWEHFEPGNYYFNGSSCYNWARIEFLIKI